MFEFDAGKLIIIGIVALIVIGPKELPGVLRQVGHAVGKMRRMAAEFQGQFMEAMREADVADIKADVTKLAESAKVDVAFNPLADIKAQITSAIDGPPGESSVALGAETPALAAPYHDGTSLNSIDLPDLPTTAAGGLSLADAGSAPASPGPEDGASRETAPAEGVEAEMKALASALEAEMAAAEPQQARAAEALGARAQEKA